MVSPLPPEIHAWETFARERGYRFTSPSGYPNAELAVEAYVKGNRIELDTRTRKDGSCETRARATARHAMLGRVEIRSARWMDRVTGIFRGRSTTGHLDLDATLSTFTSSAVLLETILDASTLEAVRALGAKPRFALVYENGAIALRWAGVELSPEPLDTALQLTAHLAVAGWEVSPYR